MHRHERLTLYTPKKPENITTPKSTLKNGPRQLFPLKNSPKVSRNLFNSYPKDETDFSSEEQGKIYSNSLPYISDKDIPNFNATVPLFYEYQFKENHLEEGASFSSSDNENSERSIDNSNDIASTDSFSYQNDDLSDCEKEVESFFLDKLEPPTHFSTPKAVLKKIASTPFKSLPKRDSPDILNW